MKRRCLVEEEAQVGTYLVITDYGIPLSQFNSFKYLGRVLSTVDENWPAVVHNLRR